MLKLNKDKRKYTGFPGDCSPQQLETLQIFKQIVKKHNGGTIREQWDDPYLLRFCRARKFDLEAMEKMWVNFINWRKANNIDNLKGNYYFPQVTQLRKIYPHGYHKHDRKYRPIYIERLGLTEPEEVFKLADEKQLLNYYAMSYETLLSTIFDACTRQKKLETGEGTRVMQTCTILDLKGIKLSKAGDAYRFAKPASQMAQDNYPQILGNMFVINAPMLFTGVWAVVKMWIDDKTKQKIQIFGSSYKKELLRYIDPENLPDFLEGGTCKCEGGDCLSLNIGPWNPEGKQFFPHCINKIEPKKEDKERQLKKFNESKGIIMETSQNATNNELTKLSNL